MSTNFELQEGVYVSPGAEKSFAGFIQLYSPLREKENRLLSEEAIRKLPEVEPNDPDFELWQIRKKSINRFLNCLNTKGKGLTILDIGCGNGFFTHQMSALGHRLFGVDAHLLELKMAASAFKGSGIGWYHLNIMQENLPEPGFDLITFCASFHYFKDPRALIQRCMELLKPGGEIHIIDSPFYTNSQLRGAQQRSRNYFKQMGVQELSNYFIHNTSAIFKDLNIEYKYKPNRFLNYFRREKDSPMPWIIIKA